MSLWVNESEYCVGRGRRSLDRRAELWPRTHPTHTHPMMVCTPPSDGEPVQPHLSSLQPYILYVNPYTLAHL